MSKESSIQGNYAEWLILGHKSNSNHLIDDIDLKIEVKSCLERHKTCKKYPIKPSTRFGAFKIQIDQHHELLRINGYYLLAVLDEYNGYIIHIKKIKASDVERNFKFTERILTKHRYYSLNWKKAFKIQGIEGYDVTKLPDNYIIQ